MTKNINNLKIGDTISFINDVGFLAVITITRIEENSVYTKGRNSWNTINGIIKKYNAKIISK